MAASDQLVKKGKGAGSFWVASEAIEVMLCNGASASQICAYLVLAAHTGPEGQYSTAGIKAIRTKVGLGARMAKRNLTELEKMGWSQPSSTRVDEVDWEHNPLIVDPKHVRVPEDEPGCERTERTKTRWYVNDYLAATDAKVWFGNGLVAGYRQFAHPLQRLKLHGDVAARMLLAMYAANDMEGFGGIHPSDTVHRNYATQKICDCGEFELWHAARGDLSATNLLCGQAIARSFEGLSVEQVDRIIEPFWIAHEVLVRDGFFYEVVAVLDRDPNDPDAQPLYFLDTRNRHGHRPKGEKGLCGTTARLSGLLGHPVTDAAGRFYGTYAVVVPAGTPVHVAGIYRLRFRVTNPKNVGVTAAWRRIHENQAVAAEWMKQVAEQLRERRN